MLIDAAQSLPHQRLDVGRLGADFVAFSGHKICGPTGIGVLFARREILESMPPVMGGGSMVVRVTASGPSGTRCPGSSRPEPRRSPRPSAWALHSITWSSSPPGTGRARARAADPRPRGPGPHRGSEDLRPGRRRTRGGRSSASRSRGRTPTTWHSFSTATASRFAQGTTVRCLCMSGWEYRPPRASFYLYNTRDEVEHLALALESIKTLLRRRSHGPTAPRPATPAATEPPNG